MFGNVFGNTVYSTSLVVAVFLLGLGTGSYLVGIWADRRYAAQRGSLLGAYGLAELAIGVIGLGITALLPRLGQVSALVSSYSREPNGWYVLSTTAQLARTGITFVLLTPITMLMGGTLTLLIRHLVRSNLTTGGRRIALLYGVNTGGAALGCFLTDSQLVPAFGLYGTQIVAVSFNLVAAAGAFLVARGPEPEADAPAQKRPGIKYPAPDIDSDPRSRLKPSLLPLIGLAIAMSGFAAMGMEILWFRHVSILLGGFRAVFSLLTTVILIGICAGSLASGLLLSRTARPAHWFMIAQGLFVALTLLGLATADASALEQAVTASRAAQGAAGLESSLGKAIRESWFNLRPILLEAGLPAFLMS